jgi:hypothetical protein
MLSTFKNYRLFQEHGKQTVKELSETLPEILTNQQGTREADHGAQKNLRVTVDTFSPLMKK